LERMRSLIQGGAALVFVTHDLDQMQAVCERAIVLEAGQVSFEGRARDAVAHYMRAMTSTATHRGTDIPLDRGVADEAVDAVSLRFIDEHDQETPWVRAARSITAELGFRAGRSIPRLVVELNMRGVVGQNMLSINSARDGRTFMATPGENRVQVTIPSFPLAGGQYFWNVRLWDEDSGTTLLDTPFRFPLCVDDAGRATGALSLEHQWSECSVASSPVADLEQQIWKPVGGPPKGEHREGLLVR